MVSFRCGPNSVVRVCQSLGCDRGVAMSKNKAKYWQTSVRFVVELRAVRTLLALGCRAARKRLERYLGHEHLLVRRYARRIAQG